ncbi:MAG: orotidine-5'-phosphate decarboxylase [Gammaproteobacteria bacterium]
MGDVGPRVIVAMDFPELATARTFAKKLDPSLCRLKVGNELFTTAGPAVLAAFHELGFDVFLDLKFHDIPNTVAKAVGAAARHGVWMVNVHASGGADMMSAARAELAGCTAPPLLIAVTVLTSLSAEAVRSIGWSESPLECTKKFALEAWRSGLDGLVCSAQDVATLQTLLSVTPHGLSGEVGTAPVLVTPGIRPAGSALNDQHRVMTPAQAIEAGSTYLVVGRPITQSSDPLHTLKKINGEITGSYSVEPGVQG